jgi:hypothetical protein
MKVNPTIGAFFCVPSQLVHRQREGSSSGLWENFHNFSKVGAAAFVNDSNSAREGHRLGE